MTAADHNALESFGARLFSEFDFFRNSDGQDDAMGETASEGRV